MGTIALDVDFSKSVRSFARLVRRSRNQLYTIIHMHIYKSGTGIYVGASVYIIQPGLQESLARKKCRRWSQIFGFGAWAEEAPLPTQIIQRLAIVYRLFPFSISPISINSNFKKILGVSNKCLKSFNIHYKKHLNYIYNEILNIISLIL